jgi:hypothetical protein
MITDNIWESAEKKNCTFSLSFKTVFKLKTMGMVKDLPMSQILTQIIEDYWERNKEQYTAPKQSGMDVNKNVKVLLSLLRNTKKE